jgi:hypothetical protein
MKRYILILLLLVMIIPWLEGGEKSAAKALLFSAIIPGSGQAYLGSYTKTGIFLASEILLVGTTLRLHQEVDWAISTYQQYAYSNAGVALHNDKETYQNIQNYISSDAYNAEMSHAAWRYFVLGYNDLDAYYQYVSENRIPEDESWDWVNDRTWQKYKLYRQDKQNIEMYSNLAVAAVVLNHLVGIIDTALTARRLRGREALRGSFYINPDLENTGMRIGYAYTF